jgi:hypothetical protein
MFADTAAVHTMVPQTSVLRFGPWTLTTAPWAGLGLIVVGLVHDDDGVSAPDDYVNDVLLSDEHKLSFFDLVDVVGLVVCRNVKGDDAAHVEVRGRSSRGKLSPGELYHHDGCSGPVRPRVVEIRCPYQEVARTVATAVAPFPATVQAMLHALPVVHRSHGELQRWHTTLTETGALPAGEWDAVQGAINRVVRHMPAETARRFFRDVDVRAGAFREPWTMGESRFIANENPGRTMQHRRAYLDVVSSAPTGKLAKRWPAEDLQPGDV